MDKLTHIFFFLNYKNQGNILFESYRLLRLLENRDNVNVGDTPDYLHINQSIGTKNIVNKIIGSQVGQREIIHYQNINQYSRIVSNGEID